MDKYLIDLWDAINKYTESCGGDTSNKTISRKRMDAAAKIGHEIEKVRFLSLKEGSDRTASEYRLQCCWSRKE